MVVGMPAGPAARGSGAACNICLLAGSQPCPNRRWGKDRPSADERGPVELAPARPSRAIRARSRNGGQGRLAGSAGVGKRALCASAPWVHYACLALGRYGVPAGYRYSEQSAYVAMRRSGRARPYRRPMRLACSCRRAVQSPATTSLAAKTRCMRRAAGPGIGLDRARPLPLYS